MADEIQKEPLPDESAQQLIDAWTASESMPEADKVKHQANIRALSAKLKNEYDPPIDKRRSILNQTVGMGLDVLGYPSGLMRTAALVPTGKITESDVMDAINPFDTRPAPAASEVLARPGGVNIPAGPRASDVIPSLKDTWFDPSVRDAAAFALDMLGPSEIGAITKIAKQRGMSAAKIATEKMINGFNATQGIVNPTAMATIKKTPEGKFTGVMPKAPEGPVYSYRPQLPGSQTSLPPPPVTPEMMGIADNSIPANQLEYKTLITPPPGMPAVPGSSAVGEVAPEAISGMPVSQVRNVEGTVVGEAAQRSAPNVPPIDATVSAMPPKPSMSVGPEPVIPMEVRRQMKYTPYVPAKPTGPLTKLARAFGELATGDTTKRVVDYMGDIYKVPFKTADRATVKAGKQPMSEVLYKYGFTGSLPEAAAFSEDLASRLSDGDLRTILYEGVNVSKNIGQKPITSGMKLAVQPMDELSMVARETGQTSAAKNARGIVEKQFVDAYGMPLDKMGDLDLETLVHLKKESQKIAAERGAYASNPINFSGMTSERAAINKNTAKLVGQTHAKIAANADDAIIRMLNEQRSGLGDMYHSVNSDISSLLTGQKELTKAAEKFKVTDIHQASLQGALTGLGTGAVASALGTNRYGAAGLALGAGLTMNSPTVQTALGHAIRRTSPVLSPTVRAGLNESLGEYGRYQSPWELLMQKEKSGK